MQDGRSDAHLVSALDWSRLYIAIPAHHPDVQSAGHAAAVEAAGHAEVLVAHCEADAPAEDEDDSPDQDSLVSVQGAAVPVVVLVELEVPIPNPCHPAPASHAHDEGNSDPHSKWSKTDLCIGYWQSNGCTACIVSLALVGAHEGLDTQRAAQLMAGWLVLLCAHLVLQPLLHCLQVVPRSLPLRHLQEGNVWHLANAGVDPGSPAEVRYTQ